MRKSIRAITAFLLCSSLILSMTACTAKTDKPSSTGGDPSTVSKAVEDNASKEPVTITAFCANTAKMPMTNELPVIKQWGEKTNSIFDFTNSPTTETLEKYNLMMASGEIPDIVIYVQEPLLKYKDAYAPLNDLLETNAPNYQDTMKRYPSLKKDLASSDGKIYTMQSVTDVIVANTFIVRQDWLDKLKLEAPKTLDDYYKVLKAFKDNDPNGNGKADEVPLISPSLRFYDAESPGLSMFAAAFGIDEQFYLNAAGDKIEFGAVDPKMKDALTYLNKLYSEKLIDQEYLTRDSVSNESLQMEGKAGMWIDWGVGVESSTIPGAELAIIAPPVGPAGKEATYSQMPHTRTNAIAISKKAENKEHIVSAIDYLFSKEGTLLSDFGIEGEQYTLVNDVPVYTDAVKNDPETSLQAVRKIGAHSWLITEQVFYKDLYKDNFNNGIDMYNKLILPPVPPLKFTDEELSIVSSKFEGEIKTYLNESLDSFITGKISLDKFDDFVAQMDKMGLPEIMKIYNESFARYQAAE